MTNQTPTNREPLPRELVPPVKPGEWTYSYSYHFDSGGMQEVLQDHGHELDAIVRILQELRDENDELRARIEALEARVS